MALMWAVAVGLLLTTVQAISGTFSGYELLSIEVRTPEDVLFLETKEFDFWTLAVPNERTSVLVPPTGLSWFKSQLDQRNMNYTVINDDIDKSIHAGSVPSRDTRATRAISGSIINHGRYYDYDEIINHIHALQSKYPGQMQIDSDTLQRTVENRKVHYIRLSGDIPSRKSIVFEAGIHAREWISPASTLYIMEKLLSGYQSGDYRSRYMLDSYTWHIIVVANPDGYAYTRLGDSTRLWRKNRRPIDTSWWCRGVYGVDLNRNFDSEFGTVGVSSSCTSEIYPGEVAFSEIETQNVKQLVEMVEAGSDLEAFVSVHSYTQMLLVPWAHATDSNDRPPNHVELDRVGKLMTQAISQRYNKQYNYGTAYQLLGYAASGGSKDWALKHKPCIYSYTYELRPDRNSPDGFMLPAAQIVPQGEELFDSLYTLVDEMRPVPSPIGGQCYY